MLDKLQRAERMGDTFEVVALTVCEVIHRVGVPLVPGAEVRDVEYAIDEWVTEEHVGVGHVDLGTQH